MESLAIADLLVVRADEVIGELIQDCYLLKGRCVERDGVGGPPDGASPSSSIIESRGSGAIALLGVRGEGIPNCYTVAAACSGRRRKVQSVPDVLAVLESLL